MATDTDDSLETPISSVLSRQLRKGITTAIKEHRDASICRAYLDTRNCRAVARVFAVSEVTVRAVLKKNNIALRRQPATPPISLRTVRDQYIAEQLQAGETLQSIGNTLNLTRERVRQLAKRIGLNSKMFPKRPRSPSPKVVQQRQVEAAVRKYRRDHAKAIRRDIVITLKRLAVTLGRTPTLTELSQVTGISPSSMMVRFVPRGATPTRSYGAIGSHRIYRAAGLMVRSPGAHGHVRSNQKERSD